MTENRHGNYPDAQTRLRWYIFRDGVRRGRGLKRKSNTWYALPSVCLVVLSRESRYYSRDSRVTIPFPTISVHANKSHDLGVKQGMNHPRWTATLAKFTRETRCIVISEENIHLCL